MKTWKHLLGEVLEDGNLEAAFKEVIDHMKEPEKHFKIVKRIDRNGKCVKQYIPLIKPDEKSRKERVRTRKSQILKSVKKRISDGTFRIESYEEFLVKDGGKWRLVQSPTIEDRIGCNAIVRVLEKHIYPTIVLTSSASIKGRGTHKLYRKMRCDIRHNRIQTMYFYKCDIKKFYQNVNQSIMKTVLRKYVVDKDLLPILDSLIELLPTGISIGLRSSQFYGNILLSHLDHHMKEREHCRYYYRYCDDIVILGADKKSLWRWRDAVHEEVNAIGLEIKPNEAVRPISEGIDFLGYVDDGEHTRIRKRIKQNAARKLSKIKSRKRRQQIIGSFKGMTKWGDCGNLFKKIVA